MKHKVLTNKILYPELSYKIQGCIYKVYNQYSNTFKEQIYQKALAEYFTKEGLKFTEQKRINIYSLETGKVLGCYVPDFLVEDKVIIELKAQPFISQKEKKQHISYLKASRYELAYLVNFGSSKLEMGRWIYTNDHKPFAAQISG